MTERVERRLKLSRETIRQLTESELRAAAAGSPEMQTAGTCPVSACICVTGIICKDLSAVCVS